METATVLKNCQIEAPNPTNLEHLERLSREIGAVAREVEVLPVVETLREKNFRYLVRREKVFKNFKYHAGLKGSYQKTGKATLITFVTLSSLIIATANTLSIVLKDPAYLVILLGIIGAGIITAFVEEAFGSSKSINYIGDIPEYILDNMDKVRPFVQKFTIHSMQPLPTESIYAKVDPVMIAWIDDEIGVVVGIWDGDKEIDVL